ncbi:response regulator [Paracoccus subflavus]|uniref:histidine kinase n=1 Tax=Paracoccus subflavus TaxID=2528244 RepID=A0A4Q9G6Z1_9RHOB|nr:response regulator [Paracoccus subflavus]TBN42596.1 response regulator [Paracoccus subflavus]
MSDELNHLRLRFGHLLVLFFWLHVPLLGSIAFSRGTMSVSTAVLIGAAVATIYQLTWYRHGTAPVTRYVSAVLLVAQPSLLLALLQGHEWQMDMHMYFFTMLALVIAWFDRTTLLIAAAVTALHHLVLLYFLPLAVFSNDGNLARVLLHAVFVIFQMMVLIWVRDKVVGSVNRIERMGTELVAKGEILKQRTHEAEQASRAKGMFLATMSHEIRTPINAIIGFCHLIQRSTLDSRQRDQITKIKSAGVTLLRLVNDILDLSKNEAGHLTLDEVVFDPRAGLSHLVQMLSEPLHKKNLRIEMHLDPQIPALLAGDATRLNQVLTNLLGNAIKFTDNGTITIVARVVKRSGDMIEIETAISDNGIGMTAEQLSRMFTPFMQADSSTTRRFGGTGLGLAICRQIVEQMNGWIRAESEPGQGSTFTIMTPLRVPEYQTRSSAMPSDEVRQLRILLVDDNPIVLRIMQEIFAQWDMAIDTADSGNLALTLARRALQTNRPYDLVILDWKMPGMDGVETLHALRDAFGTVPVPFTMMMTSYNIEEVRQDAAGKGIDLFISKPVSAESLLDALNQVPLARIGTTHAALRQGASLPQGLRVLLVDDNEINREIATEILIDAGLAVDCAANGAIACRMIDDAAADYAAVLMDVQMPEMDGITATRRIRETWPSERLPIIAMTAHAFAEERRNCLDAGMNDHLAKPVDPAHLIATLKRWLRMPPVAQPVPNAAEAGILPPALPPFDIPAALRRVNGKEALLRRLILSFSESYAGFCKDLAGMLWNGRAEEAHRLAHTLRGVAASLELAQVAALAGQIERVLSEGKAQEAPPLLAELEPLLDHAVAAAGRLQLTDAVPAGESPGLIPVSRVDPVHLAQALATIRGQIGRRSLSARQGFARLADLLQLDDAARLAHPLHLALQRLDYATASALIDRDYPNSTEGALA